MSGSERAFEDFPVGTSVSTAGRTIEMSDILAFAGLTGDHYPLHTDEEYAKGTRFGTRIAHGPLTYSMAMGLIALSGFYGHAVVAMRSCENMRALAPVMPGDTIHVDASITAAEPARRPGTGNLTVHYEVVNQHGTSVMTFDMVVIANRRTSENTAQNEGNTQ